MTVSGPCFDAGQEYTCLFGDSERVSGIFIDERRILCVSPILPTTGNIGFRLHIQEEGETTVELPRNGRSPFHSCKWLFK